MLPEHNLSARIEIVRARVLIAKARVATSDKVRDAFLAEAQNHALIAERHIDGTIPKAPAKVIFSIDVPPRTFPWSDLQFGRNAPRAA
jgi:hypothetical protein